MTKLKTWIANRLQERTSIDGLFLIAVGIGFIVFKPLASIIAYAAIGYGAYTLIKKH